MSRLIIRQVKMNDSAEFLCLAENRFGRANTTIVLIVEVSIDIREGHTDFYGFTKRILGRKSLAVLLSVVVTKKQQATYPQNTKSNFVVTTFTNKNLSCSS